VRVYEEQSLRNESLREIQNTKRINVVYPSSFRERKERSDFKIKRFFFFFFLEKETP